METKRKKKILSTIFLLKQMLLQWKWKDGFVYENFAIFIERELESVWNTCGSVFADIDMSPDDDVLSHVGVRRNIMCLQLRRITQLCPCMLPLWSERRFSREGWVLSNMWRVLEIKAWTSFLPREEEDFQTKTVVAIDPTFLTRVTYFTCYLSACKNVVFFFLRCAFCFVYGLSLE